ncbi:MULTISPECIES: type VII secretion system-associated protein [Streptomyces]|uniref:Type VII secretion system-associated protein n=1 Tax=Streptomyces lonegramiae TaxID=3075524 RepID=A0ABU2X6A1_9ACTN|nr:type VII secretion system-associated protein [Streptomyces sp. DSM 41529]MDT0541443.1 type VII secretion system-associated protein [Streptomyces sp. DSM 41529]
MSESNGEATTPATVDPAPPEEFVQAAKAAPNHWLYLTDPTWRGEAPPPEFAVVGQWRSDDNGEIVEWQANEDYVPSPGARGWPEPTDDVDRAVQLATTGYGPADDVTAALAKAELAMLVTADGRPVSASAADGTAVVPIYTSARHLHKTGPLGFERVRIADVLDRIPEGHNLSVNSSAAVSMVLVTDKLVAALAAVESAPAEETDGGERAYADQAEADQAEATSAGAREERGGQA